VTPWRLSRQVQEVPPRRHTAGLSVFLVRGVGAGTSANRRLCLSAHLAPARPPSPLDCRSVADPRCGRGGPSRPGRVASAPPLPPAGRTPQTFRGQTSYRLVPIHLHDERVTETEYCTRPKCALRCQGDLRFSFPRAARLFSSDTLAPPGVGWSGMAGRLKPVGTRGGYSPGADPICRTPMRGRKEEQPLRPGTSCW
jgi:hypothetical protein